MPQKKIEISKKECQTHVHAYAKLTAHQRRTHTLAYARTQTHKHAQGHAHAPFEILGIECGIIFRRHVHAVLIHHLKFECEQKRHARVHGNRLFACLCMRVCPHAALCVHIKKSTSAYHRYEQIDHEQRGDQHKRNEEYIQPARHRLL